jgi:hypothetical protein
LCGEGVCTRHQVVPSLLETHVAANRHVNPPQLTAEQRERIRCHRLLALGPMQELQEPAPGIIDGCMSPRMFYKLHKHAEWIADCVNECNMPNFESRVPRNSDEMTGQVMGWQFIPAEVRGEEVYRSFVHGWCIVLDAISLLLGQEQLPTPPRLYDALLNQKYRGQGQVQHFFRKGGRIEFALDFLLYHVEEIALLDILDPGSPYLSSMSRTLSQSRAPRLSSNPSLEPSPFHALFQNLYIL